MTMRRLSVAGILLSASQLATAQESDTSFRYGQSAPAYGRNSGPMVCIDAAHANRHTATGTDAPLATLLRDDGYQVQGLESPWSGTALQQCGVLVVANAIAPANARDRSLPHPPAFSKGELDTLVAWITAGGSLLLIADHTPWPGAVADLGLILGVDMLDAFATPGDSGAVIAVFGTPEVTDSAWRQYASDRGLPFRPIAGAVANPGSLGSHPILRGRNAAEQVHWVVSFTGHAFFPSGRIQPLLIFGPRAIARLDRPETAIFPVGRWLQGGAVELGRGRAVVLGEASMCTAQVGGPRRVRTGMNIPEAAHNAQFCLNVLHWLTKVIGRSPP
jgi:hypothetical protein